MATLSRSRELGRRATDSDVQGVDVPVDCERVTPELLCDWIEESYRIVAPKRLVAEYDRRTTRLRPPDVVQTDS